MIKKLLLAVAILGTATYSQAQGYVNFNTRTVGALVYDVDGTTKLSGSGFFAQLYAADGTTITDPNSSLLTAKGSPVNFGSTTSSSGYVQTSGTSTWNGGTAVDSSVAVSASTTDTQVTIQLRAWSADTTTTTYSTASKTGKSSLLVVTAAGSAGTTPVSTLTGLQSFSLTPEPTTIALGALGLSVLLFRRRK